MTITDRPAGLLAGLGGPTQSKHPLLRAAVWVATYATLTLVVGPAFVAAVLNIPLAGRDFPIVQQILLTLGFFLGAAAAMGLQYAVRAAAQRPRRGRRGSR